MLSRYVVPGNKMEIQAVDRTKFIDDMETKKVYQTQVLDILSEDRLEILMPMEKSKLILRICGKSYRGIFLYSNLLPVKAI